VLDARTFRETRRIQLANGPGMTIFSPGTESTATCAQSFVPETAVVTVADRKVVAKGEAGKSPFCPNIAATPEGDQVWLTLEGHRPR